MTPLATFHCLPLCANQYDYKNIEIIHINWEALCCIRQFTFALSRSSLHYSQTPFPKQRLHSQNLCLLSTNMFLILEHNNSASFNHDLMHLALSLSLHLHFLSVTTTPHQAKQNKTNMHNNNKLVYTRPFHSRHFQNQSFSYITACSNKITKIHYKFHAYSLKIKNILQSTQIFPYSSHFLIPANITTHSPHNSFTSKPFLSS